MADNIIHANVSMGLVSPLTIALMNMAAVLIVVDRRLAHGKTA